jgi:hypothetical protein
MNEIKMIPVNSSQIKSVGWVQEPGYEPPQGTLYVEFKNGTVYEYFSAMETSYRSLIDPLNSVGTIFTNYIKNVYVWEKTRLFVQDGKINNSLVL